MIRMDVNKIHSGQDGPYQDSYEIWTIDTNCNDIREVDRAVREHMDLTKVPTYKEWKAKYNEVSVDAAGWYFNGHADISEIGFGDLKDHDGMHRYKLCWVRPYAD